MGQRSSLNAFSSARYLIGTLWLVAIALLIIDIRLWSHTGTSPTTVRSFASLTVALLFWIGLSLLGVLSLKAMFREATLATIALRLFVFLLPLQMLIGFGGKLGLAFGLVDVGDVFLATYFAIWFSMALCGAIVGTLRMWLLKVPKRSDRSAVS